MNRSRRLRNIARNLIHELIQARRFIRDLERDLARDLNSARDFGLGFGHELDRARDLDRARALNLTRALDLDLALAFGLARTLDLELNYSRACDRACDRDRARDLDRALVHVHNRAMSGALGPNWQASSAFRDLVQVVESSQRLTTKLAEASAKSSQRGSRVRVSGWAGRLVRVAARIVPVRERSRYREEWRSELWELGEQKRGRRRRQVAHALWLLGRAWGVRGGVLAARRRPAGGG